MRHDLKLNDAPFEAVKHGRKTIELRLNDEKRRKISVGDLLVFHRASKEYDILLGRVVFLYPFESFEALYQALPLEKMGYPKEEIASASYHDMEAYYSLAQQKENGVLGIEFEKLERPYLLDGHMHLEYGPLNKEYVMEFVQSAVEKGLDEINILDHTHRFEEFREVYEPLRKIEAQNVWLQQKTKFCNTLSEYEALIQEIKSMDLPIRVKFGLEVCYTKESEEALRKILSNHSFDFLTGAVHSIHGILYDMPFSKEYLWEAKETDWIYKEYYQAISDCICSGLFDRLAHPDTIKMFHYAPSYDLTDTYRKIGRELRERNMIAESNTGAHYRYRHEDIGLSDEFLQILKEEGVSLIPASDAHHPQDVGSYIPEAAGKIRS